MEASLIAPGHPRWEGLLSAVAYDFYQLPAYCQLAAKEDGGEALALFMREGGHQMLLPLVRRTVEGDGVDAISPYGYPGLLTTPSADERFVRRALEAGLSLLASRGYISLFVRMHPLLSPRPPEGLGTIVEQSPTVVIDLEQSDEEWLAGMRKSHRQQIAKAIGTGHRAYVDESGQHFDRFKDIYRLTMRRVRALSDYHFSDAYFDDLRAALGPSLKVCVVEHDGRVWAAGLFVETNGIVQSHLSGDDGSHRSGGAKKLMYAQVRDWSKARGDRWFHLGGGEPSPGLMSFKSGFSRLRRPFTTLRVVLQPDAYARLTAAANPDADAADIHGYFPAYRQPGRG